MLVQARAMLQNTIQFSCTEDPPHPTLTLLTPASISQTLMWFGFDS